MAVSIKYPRLYITLTLWRKVRSYARRNQITLKEAANKLVKEGLETFS